MIDPFLPRYIRQVDMGEGQEPVYYTIDDLESWLKAIDKLVSNENFNEANSNYLTWKGAARCVEMLVEDHRKLQAELAALKEATKSLVNSLPDVIFDWCGQEMGWSNVMTIKKWRDAAKNMIAPPDEEPK